jgi:hypothetical protein
MSRSPTEGNGRAESAGKPRFRVVPADFVRRADIDVSPPGHYHFEMVSDR